MHLPGYNGQPSWSDIVQMDVFSAMGFLSLCSRVSFFKIGVPPMHLNQAPSGQGVNDQAANGQGVAGHLQNCDELDHPDAAQRLTDTGSGQAPSGQVPDDLNTVTTEVFNPSDQAANGQTPENPDDRVSDSDGFYADGTFDYNNPG